MKGNNNRAQSGPKNGPNNASGSERPPLRENQQANTNQRSNNSNRVNPRPGDGLRVQAGANALGAALIFGFAEAASTLLSILGVGLPPQVLLAVPYVMTIIVVAGLIGRVRGPASAGRPYEQG
jgi:hypothetical protein